ncbi:hypothetical protein ACVIIV_007347 [Bradyrhizobium sp. USDA 4354]
MTRYFDANAATGLPGRIRRGFSELPAAVPHQLGRAIVAALLQHGLEIGERVGKPACALTCR